MVHRAQVAHYAVTQPAGECDQQRERRSGHDRGQKDSW